MVTMHTMVIKHGVRVRAGIYVSHTNSDQSKHLEIFKLQFALQFDESESGICLINRCKY